MPESIISIGVQIPGGAVHFQRFSDKISLLDWDIALLSTSMRSSFYYGSESYNGKPCLSDDSSFKYTEGLNHWRKEIKDAYENGKAIVVLLEDYEEIFIATGQRSYSGTGRNQQTTRQVMPANNYGFLPLQFDVRSSIGNKMTLNPKVQYLKIFWENFSTDLSYKVTIESKSIDPLIYTKTGNKVVSGILYNKESGGYILMLPSVDFEKGSFTEKRGQKEYWSKAGTQFGNRFITTVVSIHKAIRSSSEKTPQPAWLSSDKYLLTKEIAIRHVMVAKEAKVSELQDEIQKAKEELTQVTSMKDLLYEQGKPLELAILKALRLLGFIASQFKDKDSEFDAVFECKEGRFLGEAEGKDNKPISIEKIRQLEMNINEDFARDEVNEIAKGVLFGNSCRLVPVEERKEYFTEKCLTAANRSGIALVRTQDLFFMCQNIDNLSDVEKSTVRKKMFSSVGIVDFSEFFGTQADKNAGNEFA